MKKRFQFRLRTLLGALVAMCLVLGGWHLYSVYFGPYVEVAGTAVTGEPFTVRGRFVDFLGFPSEVFVVNVSKVRPDGQRVIYQSAGGRASRSGLWNYDFEIELGRILKDGDYDIEVRPLTKAVRARKKHTPAYSLRGKMSVSSPKRQAPG